jgi:hypothetical protein
MTDWTPITKGDRKPPGYVLVTCSYTTSKFHLAVWGGPVETFSIVRIARWSIARKTWEDNSPRAEKLNNVTAWMPLPPPYEATP